MSDVFWYEFRLPEKNAAKDNGMIVSSTDSRSGSSNALVSFSVSDLDGRNFCIAICYLETLVYHV